jgi:hypothetical protein
MMPGAITPAQSMELELYLHQCNAMHTVLEGKAIVLSVGSKFKVASKLSVSLRKDLLN